MVCDSSHLMTNRPIQTIELFGNKKGGAIGVQELYSCQSKWNFDTPFRTNPYSRTSTIKKTSTVIATGRYGFHHISCVGLRNAVILTVSQDAVFLTMVL